MVQNIIGILVIIFLMAGVCWGMWKLSKWLVIPIQIVLFILLVTMIFRIFATSDNAKLINDEVEKSGIVKFEKQTFSNAAESLITEKKSEEKEKVSSDDDFFDF